tara:strand:+ start:1153 stop:1539 length:387 start_codon:yes stop_codon:yes gene_type:complete
MIKHQLKKIIEDLKNKNIKHLIEHKLIDPTKKINNHNDINLMLKAQLVAYENILNKIEDGNWDKLCEETDSLIGRTYISKFNLEERIFIGLNRGYDDYYYCLVDNNGVLSRYTCVSNLEQQGWELKAN